MLRAERDENTCRKDMTVSERVALAQKIEELEQGPAAERMASTLRQGKEVPLGSADPSGPKAMPGERSPRSADVAAAGAVAAYLDLQVRRYMTTGGAPAA